MRLCLDLNHPAILLILVKINSMEKFLNLLKDTDYFSLPITKIVLVVAAIILTLVLRQLVFASVVKRVDQLASKSKTPVDKEFFKVLRSATSILIYLATLWVIALIFAGNLTPEISKVLNGIIRIVTLVGIVFVIYRTSSLVGFFVSTYTIKLIERITGKTEEELDSNLILVLRPSIRLLIFLIGLWGLQLIFAGDFSPELNNALTSGLNLLTILIIATVIYRSASVLGQLTADLLLTATEETGLSELLRPFLPKLFQTVAIMVIVIKCAEVFFGGSTGTLLGLLGGAGITLGLLFKDIVYDWFCIIVIYTDKLYKEGDWLVVSGIDGFVQVIDVGFRTTTMSLAKWGSIQKIPNSKMITGIVENWSQDAGEEALWGISLMLKIDGISSQQTDRICKGLRNIHQSIDGVSDNVLIRFIGIEQNARVIEFRLFVNDTNLYYDVETKANLAILALLEKEGISALYVELETEPEKYHQHLQALRN